MVAEAKPRATRVCTPNEYQRAGRPDLMGGAAGNVEREQQVLRESLSRVLLRHFERRAVVRSAGGDHNMVNRARQILKERLQGSGIIGIEGRGALGAKFARRFFEAFAIASGEDGAGALGAGTPSSFKPYPSAAADNNDGLAKQFGLMSSEGG